MCHVGRQAISGAEQEILLYRQVCMHHVILPKKTTHQPHPDCHEDQQMQPQSVESHCAVHNASSND